MPSERRLHSSSSHSFLPCPVYACTPCRKSFDLGQFERFRRIMHIPAYKPLLNHEEVTTLSTLQVCPPNFATCSSNRRRTANRALWGQATSNAGQLRWQLWMFLQSPESAVQSPAWPPCGI
jgi:hypothetical protein